MKKNQTNRLSKQHKKSKGPKGIFGESAQQHDVSVRDVSISVFETLRKNFTQLEFRHRDKLKKSEINKKLNDVDARLGVTIFVGKSEIKPDGGIIEVMDKLYGPGPEPDDYFEGEISNELNLNDLRQESKSFTRESSVKSKESVRGASEFRVGPLKR